MSSPNLPNLKKAIDQARRLGFKQAQIYTMLAIVEGGGIVTPYFDGIPKEHIIQILCETLSQREYEFHREYHKAYWLQENFINYLAEHMEFSISKSNIQKIKNIYNIIAEKGEKYYGFRAFSQVVRENGETEESGEYGKERRERESSKE